ncbi:MAG TPA: hypothetical protein VL793_07630 [Patescibacteria group bacterium]|nr:hypothetical protein [Patescibacteria group bacterium]
MIPLAGLALVAYYIFFYMPLARRAASLDAPLNRDWRKLSALIEQTNSTTLDLARLTNQLNETRQALAQVENTRQEAASRLDLSPDLKAKMNSPFQLVDYQNERSKQIDELDKQAKDQKITVDPPVYAGFPEHTIDTADPSLLWPALELTDELLASAIQCKVTAIHTLDVPLPMTNSPAPEAYGRWDEIPLQVEFTASADSASRFLQSLPLRADELRTAGLPAISTNKAPLFIDRLIIRKQSPEKLDEVRIWLQAIGFVFRE